jgi:hypothetical protein
LFPKLKKLILGFPIYQGNIKLISWSCREFPEERGRRIGISDSGNIDCPHMPEVNGISRQSTEQDTCRGAIIDPGRAGIVIGLVITVLLGSGTRAGSPT